MNYEEMSDLQINLLVANAIGIDAEESDGAVLASVKHEGDNVVSVIGAVDYCNNPSDAWPIILENKMCVMHDVMAEPCDGGSWIAQPSYGYQSERVRNDNPLRAAMIVFLMMKDAQHV